MEKLLALLKSIRSDIDFEHEKQLMDDGILDSFDIVAIVAELREVYDITVTIEDLEPKNFNNVESMLALIERLMNEI